MIIDFATKQEFVPTAAWVVNPTDTALTWSYDGEPFTFAPGSVVAMDMGIAVHFQQHLPSLEVHSSQPKEPTKLKVTEPKVEETEEIDPSDKPIGEMSMQELRTFAKNNGINSFGMTKEQLVKALLP